MRLRPFHYLLLLLLLVPLGFGLVRLRFDVDVLNLLPEEVPAVKGLKLYQEHFSNARELLISVEAPEADLAERAARTLAETLRNSPDLVSAAMWQPPWMEEPAQAAELIAYLWLNQPPPELATLTNRLSGTNAVEVLESTKTELATSMSPTELARLSYDPYQLMQLPLEGNGSALGFGGDQQLFASEDGTFRLIFVNAAEELRNYRACIRWLNAIRERLKSWRTEHQIPDSVQVEFAGRPAFMAEIAGHMETDITRSVIGTLVVISILFWLTHRSWRPLVWLLLLLVFILAATFAAGGLVLGALNVVSAGFAAILLGLSVDYALVLYQEHRAQPGEPARVLRRKLAPSILWSVLTTASAFAILNWGGLPGLAQLGSLVALGVVIAGLVMFYWFLPPLIRAEAKGLVPVDEPQPSGPPARLLTSRLLWGATVLVLVVSGMALAQRGIPLDTTADALRLQNSAAYDALAEIKTEMGHEREPLWLIVSGEDEQQVADRLDAAAAVLARAQASGSVTNFTVPAHLWPRPSHQQANEPALEVLLQKERFLTETALEQGFTADSLAFTKQVFDTWRRAVQTPGVFWPENRMSDWILSKLTSRRGDDLYALGLVYPATPDQGSRSLAASPGAAEWANELPQEGTWLAGWNQLGPALLGIVERDLKQVLVPMGLLLLLSLWMAFRRASELVLSLATILFSALGLLTVMLVAGWSWNLLNLMAVPLLLGAGIDYSIHMQLALRRHGGHVRETRRVIGRALLLCAATTFAGFGSLGLSSNAGLASLGQVCAAGIAVTALTSVFLLPVWWKSLTQRRNGPGAPLLRVNRPSSLYRADFWRLGLSIATRLKGSTAERISRCIADAYWRSNRARRRTVFENLRPVCGDDRRAAEATRSLFRNFGGKLLDLWRYESGLPIDDLIQGWTGWEHFTAARARGRGVLLLTPHIGNWEFGAPLLARNGVPPLVITLAEPHAGMTELRRKSRARWGIETIVVGQDPFSFIEIIRRLESGATIALLVDRPPASSAVTVELFGRPFAASIAAAELARATGCALLPVYLPRTPAGYMAHVLPEIDYDRHRLNNREHRQKLTQEIILQFEPVIKRYIDQWYHFIPIWPR